MDAYHMMHISYRMPKAHCATGTIEYMGGVSPDRPHRAHHHFVDRLQCGDGNDRCSIEAGRQAGRLLLPIMQVVLHALPLPTESETAVVLTNESIETLSGCCFSPNSIRLVCRPWCRKSGASAQHCDREETKDRPARSPTVN